MQHSKQQKLKISIVWFEQMLEFQLCYSKVDIRTQETCVLPDPGLILQKCK